MTQTTRLVVRPATPADMPGALAVVRQSLSSGREPAQLEFYRTGPGARLFVACHDGRLVGVSCAVAFGLTGWIGNVAVHPEARGRGIGTAVSAAALDTLRRAGVATVLLTATDLGRPIYEKLGFGYDGLHYGVWRRDPAPAANGSRPGQDDDGAAVTDKKSGYTGDGGMVTAGRIEDVARLDAAATGEDRRRFLTPFATRIRVAGDGAGYRVALPWGSGPVIASSAAAARALLTDLAGAEAEPFLAFPEPNTAGADVAASLGFRQVRNIPRMRSGPPVPGFRPERVFNVFSFAVG